MAIIKRFRGLRERIKVELSEWGYDIQVYGQTVMRAPTYHEAKLLADTLLRTLSKPAHRPAR